MASEASRSVMAGECEQSMRRPDIYKGRRQTRRCSARILPVRRSSSSTNGFTVDPGAASRCEASFRFQEAISLPEATSSTAAVPDLPFISWASSGCKSSAAGGCWAATGSAKQTEKHRRRKRVGNARRSYRNVASRSGSLKGTSGRDQAIARNTEIAKESKLQPRRPAVSRKAGGNLRRPQTGKLTSHPDPGSTCRAPCVRR